VSLSPSITRPFDAPEFLFTVRCRYPARGHCFARVSYTVSTLLSGSIRGLYDSPFHGATSSNPQDKRCLCEDIAVDRRSTIDLRHKCPEIFTTNEYYRLHSELAQFKRLIPENGRACTKRIAPV
jgi:hypothetical protein